MHDPPTHVSDHEVLDVVRDSWDGRVDAVAHLPVGFGAHHWAASRRDQRRYFVTLDPVSTRRPASSFEDAYAAASELESRGLAFVHPCLASRRGTFTLRCGSGVVSLTRWRDGTTGGGGTFRDEAERDETVQIVVALHASRPPRRLREWRTGIPPRLADRLRDRAAGPWTGGPLGGHARASLVPRLDAVAGWAAEHDRLLAAAGATRDGWVTTHGEPMPHNHLVTRSRRLLVDWESALLAPAERDLRWLVAAGADVPVDPAMVRLFDLEWRLSEVDAFSAWLAAPHVGNDSDRVALQGLRQELAGDET